MTNAGISRRTLASGAAWSVPVVVAAGEVPAMATSMCQNVQYSPVLSTPTVTRNSATSATASFKPKTTVANPTGPVKPTVAVTFAVKVSGSKTVDATQNLTVVGQAVSNGYNGAGDLASDGMELIQSGTEGFANRQTLTITFDRLVSNLTFTLADIDQRSYKDQVALGGSAGSPSVANAGKVTGAGTLASPLGPSASVGDVKSDEPTARSIITYPQATNSITIDFWSGKGSDRQQIFITGMSFTASTCP